MKDFIVTMDYTKSICVSVEAENEQEAESIVREMLKENPYRFANTDGAYVKCEITDVI